MPLDTLEASVNAVFRRLNVDTMFEQTERLRNQQEKLHQQHVSRQRPTVGSSSRSNSLTSPGATYTRANEVLQKAKEMRKHSVGKPASPPPARQSSPAKQLSVTGGTLPTTPTASPAALNRHRGISPQRHSINDTSLNESTMSVIHAFQPAVPTPGVAAAAQELFAPKSQVRVGSGNGGLGTMVTPPPPPPPPAGQSHGLRGSSISPQPPQYRQSVVPQKQSLSLMPMAHQMITPPGEGSVFDQMRNKQPISNVVTPLPGGHPPAPPSSQVHAIPTVAPVNQVQPSQWSSYSVSQSQSASPAGLPEASPSPTPASIPVPYSSEVTSVKKDPSPKIKTQQQLQHEQQEREKQLQREREEASAKEQQAREAAAAAAKRAAEYEQKKQDAALKEALKKKEEETRLAAERIAQLEKQLKKKAESPPPPPPPPPPEVTDDDKQDHEEVLRVQEELTIKEQQHKKEMLVAYELHQQQLQKISAMERELGTLKESPAKKQKTPTKPKTPSESQTILSEMKKMHIDNQRIAEQLAQQVENVKQIIGPETPESSTPKRALLSTGKTGRERVFRVPSNDSNLPSEYYLSPVKGRGRYDPNSPGEEDSPPPPPPPPPRRNSAGSSRYSYTKNALSARGRVIKEDPTVKVRYAFGSSVTVRTEPRTRSSSGPTKRSTSVSSKRPSTGTPVIPNRHRGQHDCSHDNKKQAVVKRSERHLLPQSGAIFENPEVDIDDDTVIVSGGGAPVLSKYFHNFVKPSSSIDEPADLQIQLPSCCSSLHLSDAGITPKTVVQISQLHLPEATTYYMEYLASDGGNPEMIDSSQQEAAAMLAIMPLASVSHRIAVILSELVVKLLQASTQTTEALSAPAECKLNLLRIIRILSSGHEIPRVGPTLVTLVRMLRDPLNVEIIPSVVSTMLSFGSPGLLAILDAAASEPPQNDLALSTISGWNSLLLTLVANQPAILKSVVIPLVVRDLREGAAERSEAACNALIGLHKHIDLSCLSHLGEALASGRFDRRLTCLAIRLFGSELSGGSEGVSMLQSLLNHSSHLVRQAAAWGLGLHVPMGSDFPNPDFQETIASEHQPLIDLSLLSAGCTAVVHAELPSLEEKKVSPAVLYFQPQLAPEHPPYTETHVILDAAVVLQRCREAAQHGNLDLSQHQQVIQIPSTTPATAMRPSFMRTALYMSAPSEEDMTTTALFLGTFKPVSGGRGVLNPSLSHWQKRLRIPRGGLPVQPPHINKSVISRIATALINAANAPGRSEQDIKVKAEALHSLRWFPVELIEAAMKVMCPVLDSGKVVLRAGVTRLLSEVLRRGKDRGNTVDATGLIVARLSDTHPRVRLAATIALRTPKLPIAILHPLLQLLRDGRANRFHVAHTIALVVPAGVASLADAAAGQAFETNTRRACLYGIGYADPLIISDFPQLNDKLCNVLATCCCDLSPDIREQSLLSLASLCDVLINPLAPPTPKDRSTVTVSDFKRKIALVIDTATKMISDDDGKTRSVAAGVLAVSNKRGITVVQDVIFTKRKKNGSAAVAATRLSCVEALVLIPDKFVMLKTAIFALDDSDVSVRHAAASVLLSFPPKRVAIDVLGSSPAAIHEAKQLAYDLISRASFSPPVAVVEWLEEFLTLIQ